MTAFVDTSAFLAAVDRRDSSHQRAAALVGSDETLVTSDHVLAETWNLIDRITFDDDFAIDRFGRKRDRAFEVLR